MRDGGWGCKVTSCALSFSLCAPPPTHSPRCVGGVVDPSATVDREEADQCVQMHEIIKQYSMQGCFRWIVAQKVRMPGNDVYFAIFYNNVHRLHFRHTENDTCFHRHMLQ
jgi:hypothetical protein